MKKIYHKNLVENLYQNKIIDYENMLEYLKTGDFEQKHFALTFITELQNNSDLNFFIKNLVDQDTKIRELASFRVNDFISTDNSLMKIVDEHAQIILRTACDVNPQVCRNICSLLNLSSNKKFLTEKILEKIKILIKNTEKIKFKSHKTNKDIFNLYWNFFALENLISEEFTQTEEILKIISSCTTYKDYTIRERAAFIAKKLEHQGFDEIKHIIEIFKNDDNFYVKKAVN